MARVERFIAEAPVPVEQAQLIDPADFRFSTVSAQALQQIGGVLEELGERELAAKNSLAINAASKSRKAAKLKMEEFIKNNPDPNTWDEGLRKILEEQGKVYNQQRFDRETLDQQQIEQEAFEDALNIEVGIAAVTRNIENDITLSGEDLIDTISTDDGTPTAAKNTQDQIIQLKEALERKYTPEIAAIHLENTLKEAQEQQIENAKSDLMEQAAVNPSLLTNQDGTGSIDVELKARGKGKKPNAFSLLSSVDLEAIRDYANSVGEKVVSDSTIAVNAAIEDSYAQIVAGETDIATMITEIQADPIISSGDSNTAVVKIRTFFSTWNSAADPKIVTLDTTRIKALRIEDAVLNGNITLNEGLNRYTALSKAESINSTDGKQFIEKLFAANQSARNVETQRRNEVLTERTKQLRDAIEKQPSFFPAEEVEEVLKDFANVAVIQLRDKFREGEFDKDAVDTEVDVLIRKYTLSEAAQLQAVAARQLKLAKTLTQQQEQMTKIILSLIKEEKFDEAKVVADEAVLLGILEMEGGEIKKTEGKKVNISEALLKRLLEQF